MWVSTTVSSFIIFEVRFTDYKLSNLIKFCSRKTSRLLSEWEPESDEQKKKKKAIRYPEEYLLFVGAPNWGGRGHRDSTGTLWASTSLSSSKKRFEICTDLKWGRRYDLYGTSKFTIAYTADHVLITTSLSAKSVSSYRSCLCSSTFLYRTRCCLGADANKIVSVITAKRFKHLIETFKTSTSYLNLKHFIHTYLKRYIFFIYL